MALELRSICRRFGRQRALDRVCLTVESGDCYGFLGHNGAGKTTTMRIALGLLRPGSGQVLVDGFSALRHPREARARMGGLIEVPGFHGSWSGARNLSALARLQGLSRASTRQEVQRLLDLVGLAAVGRKHVRAYSHGMRQRLGIAQALLGNPAYVLLDEPTNGLDPEGMADMRALLLRLREEGQTVLVSSHQLGELSGICNRIGIIRAGRMLVEGTPAELGGSWNRYRLACDDPSCVQQLAILEIPLQAAGPGQYLLEMGDHDPKAVLAGLVSGGLGVGLFAPEERSLESIYLHHTHAEQTPEPKGEHPPAPVAADASAAASALPSPRRAPAFPTLRVLRYDLGLWLRRPAIWLLLASPAVLAAAQIVSRAAENTRFAAEVSLGSLASTTEVTGFEGLGVGLRTGLPLLSFILLGLASLSISSERGQGTLRNLLLRPVRRWQVVTAKGASILVALLAGYVLLVTTSLLTCAVVFDFGDVSEVLPNGELYLLTRASDLWPDVYPLLQAPLLPLASFAALGLLAGTLVRRASTGMAAGLMVGVGMLIARYPGRVLDFERWLPAAYLPWPDADRSYVAYYLDLVTGAVNAEFRFEDTAVILPLLCVGLCLVLASLVFIRRSVP